MTRSHNDYELSLRDAQQAVLDHVTPLDSETIPITQSLGRIPSVSLTSTSPKPIFDQSTMDGYALAKISDQHTAQQHDLVSFRLAGEIAAGRLDRVSIRPGEAIRIMTGAMLPHGAEGVVPFEFCRESRKGVEIPVHALAGMKKFIRKRGSDLKTGRVIVPKGRPVLPDHLLLLSENRYTEIPLFRQPRTAVLCTGSELVEPGMKIRRGQKISGNSLLLHGLLKTAGAISINQGPVADRANDIADALKASLAAQPHMIVTTGGMGPGKYDLISKVVDRLGGSIIYHGLQVRPGRATLFALLDDIPLFALPGPPPAVRLLFHELVAPALRKIQGRRKLYPQALMVRLTRPVHLKKRGRMNLKGAVVSLKNGTFEARPATTTEPMNGILLLPQNRNHFQKGRRAKVHLVGPETLFS